MDHEKLPRSRKDLRLRPILEDSVACLDRRAGLLFSISVSWTLAFYVLLEVLEDSTGYWRYSNRWHNEDDRAAGLVVGAFLLLFGLIYAISHSLMRGALTFVALAPREQTVTFKGANRFAITRVIPLVLTDLLSFFALSSRFSHTIVGGLIVGGAWSVIPSFVFGCVLFVAVPALIHEGLNPARALKRSAALTRGARLRILLLAVMFVAFESINTMTIDSLLRHLVENAEPLPHMVAYLMIPIATASSTVLSAVTYMHLRRSGASIDSRSLKAEHAVSTRTDLPNEGLEA